MARGIVKKFTIELDESDAAHFRERFRAAKKEAESSDPGRIVAAVHEMIGRVQAQKRIPSFLEEATSTLRSLVDMVSDKDWAMAKGEAASILAGLAYFLNPSDLIPDDVPGMGFLDDAIFVWLLGEEFHEEIRAYRAFRRFKETGEQRDWTEIARARWPKRLAEERKRLREELQKRREAARRGGLLRKVTSRLRW